MVKKVEVLRSAFDRFSSRGGRAIVRVVVCLWNGRTSKGSEKENVLKTTLKFHGKGVR
jgi:hypothetical protein